MDIGRAFRAVFDDPAWVVKLGVAFLFEILVVTGPAVIGYFMQYIHNVAEGHDTPLPDWGGFGTYWVRGVVVILAAIVYVIVGLLLFIIGIIPALILLQGGVIEYAMTGQAGSLFALGTVWRRIAAHSQFWLAWAIGIGLGIVVSIVGTPFSSADSAVVRTVGALIGALLGLYTAVVTQHLYGQYARFAYGYAPVPAPQQQTHTGYPPGAPTSPGGPTPAH